MTTRTRPTKIENVLAQARETAKRSPCSRRQFGAILTRDGTIISTGYNGSCRGAYNCGEEIPCIKDLHNEPSYKSYDNCPAVHAEQNAIINAARSGAITVGATMYLASAPNTIGGGDRPCHLCRRYIINAGIAKVIYTDKDGNIVTEDVEDWVSMENAWMEERFKEIDIKAWEEIFK